MKLSDEVREMVRLEQKDIDIGESSGEAIENVRARLIEAVDRQNGSFQEHVARLAVFTALYGK